MSTQRFAQLDDQSKTEHEAQTTRTFEGTGTSFLPIDPLVSNEVLESITSIRIGLHMLPLVETRDYPINAQMQTKAIVEPMVEVQTSGDGKQHFLVRSVLSNDGIWPKGTNVHINGKWQEQLPATQLKDDQPPSGNPSIPVKDLNTLGQIAELQASSDPNHIADQAHRMKVALETGDNRALTNEGINPTIVDPVGAVTGIHTPAVNEALTELSSEIMDKIRLLGTPHEAMTADPKRYNEIGISGQEITRIKNALRRALESNE